MQKGGKKSEYGRFKILFLCTVCCVPSSDPAKNDSLKLWEILSVMFIKLLQCLMLDRCSV